MQKTKFIGVIDTSSKLFGKMRKEIEFWQWCCRNCKKKYNVSRERENWISAMRLLKFLSCPSSAHEVPQVHARGSVRKRKQLWQPSCRNCRNKERENMNCGNQVAKNEGKKDATFTIFLHHFHNKLKVVSCYWFKFEPNTKITFLPQ